jgi:GTP-binding protein LepA
VLNKIDLPSADPDRVIEEIEDIIGIPAHDAIRVSAKTGEGVDDVLEAVIARIPPPTGDPGAPLSALVIDAWFDNYVGVVMLVRVVSGTLKPRDKVRLMATGAVHNCEQVGVFTPKAVARGALAAGEVGFIVAGVKELAEAKVGDTITLAARPASAPLPGFREVKPQVFAGLYPVESNQYEARASAREAQAQRRVAALEPEVSQALGFAWCGFLGLCTWTSSRSASSGSTGWPDHDRAVGRLQVLLRDGTVQEIDNPSKLPDPRVEEIREPVIAVTILVPQEYVGSVLRCYESAACRRTCKRGRQV